MLDPITAQILDWFRYWGELTPATGVFVAAIFVVASLGIPRVLLSVGTGAAFGMWSLAIVQPSATIGALLAFLISRHLVAQRARRRLETNPVATAIAEAIDSEGWRIVALIRLASPIPSSVASYVFGLTRIGVVPYTIATLVFTLPQNILFVYLGATGRAVMSDGALSPLQLGLFALGLVCLGLAVFLISRTAARALRARRILH
jgi:uncharacterized membrane protein YdjX (TVP38/TMEM64 family)